MNLKHTPPISNSSLHQTLTQSETHKRQFNVNKFENNDQTHGNGILLQMACHSLRGRKMCQI